MLLDSLESLSDILHYYYVNTGRVLSIRISYRSDQFVGLAIKGLKWRNHAAGITGS